ncbi:MAG: hypothetical protein JKY48_01530 [Flavobacteriales bacterium]|nr:hypothetical protein [Flavobacteriales bacterium]
MTQVHNKAGEVVNYGSTISASTDSNTSVTSNINNAVSSAGGLSLVGFSCAESAASPAAASFVIKHGGVSGGTNIIYVELAASSTDTKYFGDSGIACANGISIDWIAGEYDISLFYKVL